MEAAYKRTNKVLLKKFIQYLIPTMATYAALSLNEFLDSMIVSNLLGANAMAVVNLGMPLMLLMAALFSLLGSGGATLYAISLGKRDHETAGKSTTAAITVALASGLFLLAAGFLFFTPLSHILCRDAALQPDFDSYLRILLLSSPFLVTILTFTSFLPAAGYPGSSMIISVIANVVNILMDYVYIRFFHMGVEGAAWATLTGYLLGAVAVVCLKKIKKMRIDFSRSIRQSIHVLKEIIKKGGPDALTQIGFSLQFAACNGIAAVYAGTPGVISMSLCIQALSFISIFISALIGSTVPMLSVLHGQRDLRGKAAVLRIAMIGQFVIAVLMFAMFELLAPQVATLYNVHIIGREELRMAVTALRIYSITFLIRSSYIVYYRYLIVTGFNGYAALVSTLDGFAAIIPVAWLMSCAFGIVGLWWAFPATAVLILLFVILNNRRIAARSNGKYTGVLLLENDEEARPVLDVTITKDAASITGLSEKIRTVCEENGVSRQDAVHAALAIEEMAVYISQIKEHDSYIDILVRLYKGNVEIDFRSLGERYRSLNDAEAGMTENVRLLRGIASSIESEYTLGMNSTRIVISAS